MIQPSASRALARFATQLRRGRIPDDVVDRAIDCLVDAVGVAVHGSTLPWSQAILAHVLKHGRADDGCTVFGVPGIRAQGPAAALANGAFAHAFEQDSLREPGAGVHPGASVVPSVLAAAEWAKASGPQVVTAIVAAIEAMFRIGLASRHSSEALGFHAPGLTGPYGAALGAGVVMGLDEQRLVHALGIAGSMSAGLMAFAKAPSGAMVKRLHLGRASEAGFVAASLASEGFEGPETVLDGRYGFLEAYCENPDVTQLTLELGERWETRRICIKRYACHATAQAAVQVLRSVIEVQGIDPSDIEGVQLEAADKVREKHGNRQPADVMQAQYSLPFCLALAVHRDPGDPRSFDQSAITDQAIRGTLTRIQLCPPLHDWEPQTPWHTRMTLKLRGRAAVVLDARTFDGTPEAPLARPALRRRFLLNAASLGPHGASRLLGYLEEIERQARLDELRSAQIT